MTSAKTYAKALRYIRNDKLSVYHLDDGTVLGRVEGDTGVWLVTGDDTGWSCTCPSVRTCAHIIATEALTSPADLQK